jgi:cyclopropane fatty-acyl-phospholipid synthase-like methyltransferase
MSMERIYPSHKVDWAKWGLQHVQRYEFVASLVRNKTVLDVACGCGYGAYIVANAGAAKVVGMDLSSEAISYAQNHYEHAGLEFVQGNCLASAPPEAPFDVVLSFETIEHLEAPEIFLSRIACILKQDGFLALSAPNRLYHGQINPFHINEPDHETLTRWIGRSFATYQEFEQSPVCWPHSAVAMQIYQSKFLNLLLDLENRLRKLLRKQPIDFANVQARCHRNHLVVTHAIVPLLPERRKDADVFIMLCRGPNAARATRQSTDLPSQTDVGHRLA